MKLGNLFKLFVAKPVVVEPTKPEAVDPVLGLTQKEMDALKGMHIDNIKRGIAATGNTPEDSQARALVNSSVDALRAMHANEQPQPPNDPKYPVTAGFDLNNQKT